jgi:hypothetical protein
MIAVTRGGRRVSNAQGGQGSPESQEQGRITDGPMDLKKAKTSLGKTITLII